jgi:hypothetical protein
MNWSCRVVGVPALAVLALEVAILAGQHVGVVVVEEGDHGGAPDAARDGCRADGAHHVVGVERAQERALARHDPPAHEVEHPLEGLGAGRATALDPQRGAGLADEVGVETDVAALEPALQAVAQGIGPTLGGVLDDEQIGLSAGLALDTREVLDVLALDGVADAAAAHRDDERLTERVDALDGLVGAVVDGDVVAPGGRAGHREQAHARHHPHLEDALAEALVGVRGETVSG